MNLSDYLKLPWTVERSDHNDDGEYLSLEIRELPGFVVAARTADEADAVFWEALEAFLRSYTDVGEVPPVPETLPKRPQLELIPDQEENLPSATKFVGDGPDRYHTTISTGALFASP